MPRIARASSESDIYHVMQRGNNKKTIFYDDEDCQRYLECLQDCKSNSGFELYAYCLMGNHTHLLIKTCQEPLSQIFKRIGSKYVYWYNKKYDRCGHLFQDRFKSEPIVDDKQFIAVLRYIFQNPVDARICVRPDDYKWSSFRYLGSNNPLIDHTGITDIITVKELKSLTYEKCEEQFLDLSQTKSLSDIEVCDYMKKKWDIGSEDDFKNVYPNLQEEYIRELYGKGCTIRQLSRVTGLYRSKIGIIVKNGHKL